MQSECLLMHDSYRATVNSSANSTGNNVNRSVGGFSLSMISNRHGRSVDSSGFMSPAQLFSPAPVRSGKTPTSPVAPMELVGIFSSAYSDDDDDDSDSAFTSSHQTRLSKGTFCETTPTNVNTMDSSGELFGNRSPELAFRNSEHVLFRSDCSHSRDKYHFYTFQPNTSQDDTVVQDEEFAFRMLAEPVSLAGDVANYAGLHTAIVIEDTANSERSAQTLKKSKIKRSSSSQFITTGLDLPTPGFHRSSRASCSLEYRH